MITVTVTPVAEPPQVQRVTGTPSLLVDSVFAQAFTFQSHIAASSQPESKPGYGSQNHFCTSNEETIRRVTVDFRSPEPVGLYHRPGEPSRAAVGGLIGGGGHRYEETCSPDVREYCPAPKLREASCGHDVRAAAVRTSAN